MFDERLSQLYLVSYPKLKSGEEDDPFAVIFSVWVLEPKPPSKKTSPVGRPQQICLRLFSSSDTCNDVNVPSLPNRSQELYLLR